ncbi:three-helix bundle dimerization domain-containing protein [Rhodococcus jostii]
MSTQVSEQRHLDRMRRRLHPRFPHLPPGLVEDVVAAAHRRFDGCRIRDFVPILVERIARDVLAAHSQPTSTTHTPPARSRAPISMHT